MEQVVRAEWEKVKDEPSLFRFYGNQKDYQRWRTRFIKAGLIQKTSRTWTRKADPIEHRRAYAREYYTKWRKENKDRQKQYAYNHWKNRFIEQMVCLKS